MPSPKRKAKTRISRGEHRRMRVFELMASSEIKGHVLIENMDVVCKWLKDGIVRREDGKPVLKTVSG